MKLIDKSKLTYSNGWILYGDDECVAIDSEIIRQYEALDTAYQQYKYLVEQPKPAPIPTLDGFKRKHIGDANHIAMPDTPTIDKMVEESKAYMAECKAQDYINQMNLWIDNNSELVEFITNDSVMIDTNSTPSRIDAPTLKNILDVDISDIRIILKRLCEYDIYIAKNSICLDYDGDSPILKAKKYGCGCM